jgi:hypothetical protein
MTTPERAGGWVQPKAPGANAVKVATTNESRTDGPCGGVRAESRQRKAAQGAIRATLPQRQDSTGERAVSRRVAVSASAHSLPVGGPVDQAPALGARSPEPTLRVFRKGR